jgi:hypothetical protein
MVERMEQTKRSPLRTCAICWFPRVVSLKSHHFISFLPPHQLFFARFSSCTPDIGARENDKIHEFDAAAAGTFFDIKCVKSSSFRQNGRVGERRTTIINKNQRDGKANEI